MFAFFARSICTHCLPGPSSTQDPSSPALSLSVTRSRVPVTGLSSLAVTFLPFARLTVPAGTMKSARLPFRGGARFGTLSGTGVPTKRGRGSWVLSGTLSCAIAAVATSMAATMGEMQETDILMNSGSHFFIRDANSLLGGYSFIGFMDDIFARESFIGRAVQFCSASDGVEEILKVGLMRRLVEEDRDFILGERRSLADIYLGGVSGERLGIDIAFLLQLIPSHGSGA